MATFPFFRQLDQMDCGPTCLRMIAKFYGKSYSTESLREKSRITRDGVSLAGISEAAESIGLRSVGVSITLDVLCNDVPLPVVAHWRQRHFVVIFKIEDKGPIHVADPAFGIIKYNREDFLKGWLNSNVVGQNEEGLAMLFDPTPEFYSGDDLTNNHLPGLRILFPYLRPFGKLFIQLFLGLFLGSMIQVAFPFLTQSVVDFGINFQDVHFIYLILFAQLTLFLSQTSVQLIRGWLLLHITNRININLLSDFLIKLLKLPIGYFDSKNVGDILQRINDQNRIQTFLSAATLNVLFSIVNVMIFGLVLVYYNGVIFIVFTLGATLYVVWVRLFMKKRAILEYQRFDQASDNQSTLYQLINGMQEIKLNNSERRRRWEWEAVQARLFKISIKGLSLAQTQASGALFIDQLKDIVITFLAATLVIEGQITIGMMLSIQFIIGQLNLPIHNFISFSQNLQDARISLERLSEIHKIQEEEVKDNNLILSLPSKKSISFENISFRYGTQDTSLVLDSVNVVVPEGKVTAIVGASGSGKTTLLKVLLKFYRPSQGTVKIGDLNLEKISHTHWRMNCGTVMQDGFIFSDSIVRNITESSSEGQIDKFKLKNAVRISNLEEFIESLPNGYNTKIGLDGISLSGGERLRILIARAVYKDPQYLFFDEATSSLDANNEKEIMQNLEQFFKGRTVITIAHRLSTVKNADQIVVLGKGKVIEIGTHLELSQSKGAYYALVKNQLELGA